MVAVPAVGELPLQGRGRGCEVHSRAGSATLVPGAVFKELYLQVQNMYWQQECFIANQASIWERPLQGSK